MEELLEGVTDEMQILTEDMKEMEEEPPADLTSDIKSVINRGVKFREMPINEKFSLQESYPNILRKAQVMIQNLVTEVQAIMETRKSYEMRGLKKGRLHSGSLYKLAVPNVDVFSRNTLPGHDPTMVIYLLVDMSGSMGIGNRIGAARLATCVLGETCKTLQIKYKITGFSGDTRLAEHYIISDWDEDGLPNIAHMCEYHENRDGYSIRVATKDLELQSEERKILIILSDGVPAGGTGYGGQEAIEDTKEAVIEARKKGLEIISIYFGHSNDIGTFRYMYHNPVFVETLNLLPSRLGASFKKVLFNE